MIQRRRVFFIEGYEPQGASGFYRMFRREWMRFRATWPVRSELSECKIESAESAVWSVETAGPNWRVSTQYEFLRLEGLIRDNLKQPFAVQLGRTLRWIADDIMSGALKRVFSASWRMGVLLLYSQVLLILWLALSLAGGWFAGALAVAEQLPVPTVWIAGIGGALGSFALLFPAAERMFVNQLNNCWPYLREFARGKPTVFDEPLKRLAARIVGAAQEGDTDEILVIGHSAGAMMAVTAMAEALRLDPGVGRHGPRVVLLTVGSIMPALALHPAALRLRESVATIATEPSLLWTDCQSADDFMNFRNFDPVAGIGIDAGPRRCNPRVWPVPVRDMIAPEVFAKVKFNYWRMHYQYLMSNDRRAAYDYYMFLCGPLPFADWAAQDGSALDNFDANAFCRSSAIRAAE